MAHLHNAFDWASELYAAWFSEWLHVHFTVRTAILLLILWGALFTLAQLFQYVLGPFFVLFYRHIIFRAYNYLCVETTRELIYIRFYSKDSPTLHRAYLRLTDKAKKNRLLLSHTKYKGILYRGGVKRAAWVIVVTVGVASTLWLTAFGLHQEYYVPALAGIPGESAPNNGREPNNRPTGNGTDTTNQSEPNGETNANNTNHGEAPPNHNEAPPNHGNGYDPSTDTNPTPFPTPTPLPDIIYPPGYVNPASWPDAPITLRLNVHGSEGARLRDVPGFGGVVTQMVWGGATLEYLGAFVPDADVSGLYWLRVRVSDGPEGYIASYLIEIE
ncbi:MAG: SH3 domain-containing protein [Defluviitaleaceae bacterium]|nr:SH3 domain-containing protein [Defluviitaleaceae bacterium]